MHKMVYILRLEKNSNGKVVKLMFCQHCGSELENGAKFCGNCGAPIASVAQNDNVQQVNQGTPIAAPVVDKPTPVEGSVSLDKDERQDTSVSVVPSRPVKKWWQKTWFAWVLLFVFPPIGIVLLWVNGIHGKIARVIISLIFALAFIGAVSDDKTPSSNSQTSSTSAVTAKVQPPKENVSREYKNALRSAEQYLKVMPMSKNGLYHQLTSPAGDKYPAEAARYAVEHVKTDWKLNALKSAENYLKIMPMSRQGLYQQLTSDAGDKYTAEEAQYAIDHIKW